MPEPIQPRSHDAADLHGDMPPEEFRFWGQRTVDWAADYLADPARFPVLAQVEPGQIAAALPTAPPAAGEPMGAILADFERQVMPGITHWNAPGFLAYFGITGSGPGVLGELIAATLNVNGMLWRTSPAVTELEARTLDWLRQMIGLPAGFAGTIHDTA